MSVISCLVPVMFTSTTLTLILYCLHDHQNYHPHSRLSTVLSQCQISTMPYLHKLAYPCAPHSKLPAVQVIPRNKTPYAEEEERIKNTSSYHYTRNAVAPRRCKCSHKPLFLLSHLHLPRAGMNSHQGHHFMRL